MAYTNKCRKCGTEIVYSKIKTLKCPICNAEILPCDGCTEENHYKMLCSKCKYKKEKEVTKIVESTTAISIIDKISLIIEDSPIDQSNSRDQKIIVKKRGRPRKTINEILIVKKKRGRPRKNCITI